MTRLRRTRRFDWSRRMMQENHLQVSDLIWPLFVMDGANTRSAIASMPSVERLSVDLIVEQAAKAADIGIPCIAIFPQTHPDKKDAQGTEALNPDNLVCRAVLAIRAQKIDIGIMCDVALDPYTSHGHDGVLDAQDYVANDASVLLLVKQALLQAQAGCDILAPSDMMDGRVMMIREELDDEGFDEVSLLSYSAKFASHLYGPFRDAIQSRNNIVGADKKTYQMDYRNSRESLIEAELDLNEGADIIMVKPAGFYLDIIKDIKANFNIPVFAYQVSGEYAMIKFAGLNNCFDEQKVLMESLIAIKRAGSSAIFTYGALEAAKILAEK